MRSQLPGARLLGGSDEFRGGWSWSGRGVPTEHFRARPASLAVVDNRYFQDFPRLAGGNITGGTRQEFGVILTSGSVPVRLPGRLIEYVTARPDVVWSRRTPSSST